MSYAALTPASMRQPQNISVTSAVNVCKVPQLPEMDQHGMSVFLASAQQSSECMHDLCTWTDASVLLAPSPLLTHIIDPAMPGMAVLWDSTVSGPDKHSCLAPVMPVQWQSVQQLLRCKESAAERTFAL